MIRKIELKNRQEVFFLLDLQSVSYGVEARLIGFNNIPPLHDTIHTLQLSEETFYGYFINRRLVGALSFKRKNDIVEICRLMVHPDHFRRGIASSLIAFLEEKEEGVRQFTVMTGAKNEPAIQLYKKLGFVETEQNDVVPGVPMIAFKKIVV